MTEFEKLKQEFVALRQKVRDGNIFQSLGDLMAEALREMPPKPSTEVILPVDGEYALQRIQEYTHQLDLIAEADPDVQHVDFHISDTDLHVITEQLANPQPQYRDTGAFFFLSDMVQNDLLAPEQLRWLTEYLSSDEQLFSHILEPHNDGIYRRSFSVMILSLLLYANRVKKPFLSDSQLDDLIDQVALYAALERDGRGFIGQNGWAHAFTHVGNAAAEIFLMPQLIRADKLFLMSAMLAGFRELSDPLTFGETGRLVEVLSKLAKQHALYSDYMLLTLKNWRKDLVTQTPPKTQARWQQFYNRSQFFHEIILLNPSDVPKAITDYVNETKNYLS